MSMTLVTQINDFTNLLTNAHVHACNVIMYAKFKLYPGTVAYFIGFTQDLVKNILERRLTMER